MDEGRPLSEYSLPGDEQSVEVGLFTIIIISKKCICFKLSLPPRGSPLMSKIVLALE